MGETNFIKGEVAGTTDAGAVNIRTPLGDVLAANIGGPRWPDGSSVMLSVRPEVIQVGTSPLTAALATNVFDGIVRDTVYLGEVAQHFITATDVELRAFELNPESRRSRWLDQTRVDSF